MDAAGQYEFDVNGGMSPSRAPSLCLLSPPVKLPLFPAFSIRIEQGGQPEQGQQIDRAAHGYVGVIVFRNVLAPERVAEMNALIDSTESQAGTHRATGGRLPPALQRSHAPAGGLYLLY